MVLVVALELVLQDCDLLHDARHRQAPLTRLQRGGHAVHAAGAEHHGVVRHRLRCVGLRRLLRLLLLLPSLNTRGRCLCGMVYWGLIEGVVSMCMWCYSIDDHHEASEFETDDGRPQHPPQGAEFDRSGAVPRSMGSRRTSLRGGRSSSAATAAPPARSRGRRRTCAPSSTRMRTTGRG